MNLFSIIMPLYNKEKQVCDAVESVLKQTYKDFELLIIDDGSTDQGVQAISAFTQDKRLQILQQENAGVSSARNNGIRHARNDFICFLDADDLWMPNHLKVLRDLICRYPDAGLFATRHKLIEADGTERIMPMKEDFNLIDDLFQAELDTGYNYLHTNSICIPHKILADSGLFEVGERTGEDTSLWLRIAARYDLAMAKSVTTIYRREFSDAFVGLALNPTWSFLRYSDQLLELNSISDKKKNNIRRYINRYRISLCRHALLTGNKDNANIYYKAVNWTLQGKKEKLITDVCSLIPSTVLRAIYHKKYKNSFKPKDVIKNEESIVKTIYYLGAYRSEYIEERNPQGSMAEDNKMKYIINTMKDLGYCVVVISVLASLTEGFHKRKICEIDSQETHVYLESYDTCKHGISKFAALLRLFCLFLFLIKKLTKDDTLLVYHSQLFSVPVRLAKKIRKFRFLLEIEEIFYMDDRNPKDIRRKGIEVAQIDAADGYLVASELLAKKVEQSKEAVVVYGGLNVPPRYTERFDDGKIHIVYAGGIDSLRNIGLAIDSMQYLDTHYVLHILGYGDVDAIKQLQQQILHVNSQLKEEQVIFHGSLHGREYDTFLQKCDIGLNLQMIGASIEDVAFPSKISSYFGRGLNVVSGKISSVINSKIANSITFYCENKPDVLGEAIKSIKLSEYENQIQIAIKLDQLFKKEFDDLLLKR